MKRLNLENTVRNTKSLQWIYYATPDRLKPLLIGLRSISLFQLRYCKKTYSYLEELMRRDQLTESEIGSLIQTKIQKIIGTVGSVPFYSKSPVLPTKLEDFSILERDQVRQNSISLLNPCIRSPLKFYTAGTSGSGMLVYVDSDAYIQNWAYWMKHRIWAGLSPRQWRISFFGARLFPLDRRNPPFWIKNKLEHQYLASIFHISDQNAGSYIQFLEDNQDMYIEGFPTVLYLISQFVKAHNAKLKFPAVFSTSEPLYPHMRDEIEEAFGTKIFDAYGMSEMCGLIMECEKGGYHVISDYGYLEIYKSDQMHAKVSEEGYFVWTSLINQAMPLIRYKIGDIGYWEPKTCACGRPFPCVKPTITRDSDYLVLQSGIVFSPRTLNQFLKNKTSFKVCQFIQENRNEIIVRVVPDLSKNYLTDLKSLMTELRILFQNEKELRIEEEIASEPIRRGIQGKIPLVISRLDSSGLYQEDQGFGDS